LSDQKPIRAILFDLDGTLLYSRPNSSKTMLEYAVGLGAPDSPAARQKNLRWVHYYWAQSTELLADLEIYDSLSSEFWLYYTQRSLLAFDCSPQQALELAPEVHRKMNEEYKSEPWVPEDIPASLAKLRSAGFALAVVSNRSTPLSADLTQHQLEQYFDLNLCAGQVNSWKPDPQIFWHALEKLQVKPHEAVYVGDNFYADVIGARNAGLEPILIDPDHLFPDAHCSVIRQISDLPNLLCS